MSETTIQVACLVVGFVFGMAFALGPLADKAYALALRRRRPPTMPAIWGVVVLTSALFGCSDGPRLPASASPVSAPIAADGSARVTTQSTRDLAPVSPGNQCPSGAVTELEFNGHGDPGQVLVKFRRTTNEPTIAYYAVRMERHNQERPNGREPAIHDRIPDTESDLNTKLVGGTYDGYVHPVCVGGKTGGVAMKVFSVAGPEPVALPRCALYPESETIDPKNCVRD